MKHILTDTFHHTGCRVATQIVSIDSDLDVITDRAIKHLLNNYGSGKIKYKDNINFLDVVDDVVLEGPDMELFLVNKGHENDEIDKYRPISITEESMTITPSQLIITMACEGAMSVIEIHNSNSKFVNWFEVGDENESVGTRVDVWDILIPKHNPIFHLDSEQTLTPKGWIQKLYREE